MGVINRAGDSYLLFICIIFTDEKKRNILNTDIWFHFKGGFSNGTIPQRVHIFMLAEF
jgi:hypothetical protein